METLGPVEPHKWVATAGSAPVRIDLKGVGKSFNGVSVLCGVDLTINGGEIHTLMGENGAGKSTLVKILSGVQPASAGTLSIDGQPVSFHSPGDAEARGIIIMHQELSLIPEMSVAQNVSLGHETLKFGLIVDRSEARRRAESVLSRFGFAIDTDTLVKDLRVGEQQLVEIARALLMDARLLIMDEPTSALSQAEADILMEVVRDLALQGVAILYISHRIDEVFEISDRITVLRDGELIGSVMAAEVEPSDVIEMMVGRYVEANKLARHNPPTDEVVLEVKDITASAGGRLVLSDVSFSLHRGEILGIAGLLGAGRTELLETIFGARGANFDGEVFIRGKRVDIRQPSHGVDHGLALITEDRKTGGLTLNATLADNVILPLLPRISRFGLRSNARKESEASQAIKRLRIACQGTDHIVGLLSGGNQQKVVLGKWLAMNPQILLLDEPTRGIDIGAKDEIYKLAGELADTGISIVIASSEIPELMAVCDRVMVLCEGRVTGVLDADEFSYDAIKHLSMQFL